MSDVRPAMDPPEHRGRRGDVMSRVREMVARGVPDPEEGELIDECPSCGARCTWTKASGSWRTLQQPHDAAIHDGKATQQIEAELQPPRRTYSPGDADDE